MYYPVILQVAKSPNLCVKPGSVGQKRILDMFSVFGQIRAPENGPIVCCTVVQHSLACVASLWPVAKLHLVQHDFIWHKGSVRAKSEFYDVSYIFSETKIYVRPPYFYRTEPTTKSALSPALGSVTDCSCPSVK